ncbi:transcription termination factor 4, mitochondrial isoform X2 [Contarinia nasturtii]|uniref:transcription termination factor 4, mitochondrial isoform X2 n=1 Tax=Contarinia nasturtii TaxID=265458 RepID=UPI0012D437E6|nr:transcription termination factor 4, mitochondrial isoform X2 [Contarinia nasturtii]
MFRLRHFSLLLRSINNRLPIVNFSSAVSSDWISKIIEDNEKVAYFGRDSVESTYNIFHKSGFTHENCIKIINTHPDLMRLAPNEIEKRLDMWHMAQFSQTQFFDLFAQCPELLDFDDSGYIAKRYGKLREIFFTPKNIWRILMASPNVMVDSMTTIKEKVDYILNTMEADVTDLVKSGSLGLPLKTIKTRHVLLARLGIYKKRNFRISELDANKNPRLARIMNASDEEFAKKTCAISTNEFEAFCELYERELDEMFKEQIDYEEDSDAEDSDDTDSDEEDYDPREVKDYYDDRNRKKYCKTNKKYKK